MKPAYEGLRQRNAVAAALSAAVLAAALFTSCGTPTEPPYTILAANDLGMHCIQSDYSKFMILPPGNNLRVQVFQVRSEEAILVKNGITVEYAVNGNTTSADKINFWTYASNFGFTLAANVGISGNGLSGTCKLSADGNYWEASFIPVTQYSDKANPADPAFPVNYYQTVTIKVKRTSDGALLASTDKVVLPVSDEMSCSACHGPGLEPDILTAHDTLQGTTLASSPPKACSDCHADPILGRAGTAGVPTLSSSMHSFHSTRMTAHPLPDPNPCYACHPGPATQCLRGAMFVAGKTCTDCHGGLAVLGNPARTPWMSEPSCAGVGCHDSLHQPQAGLLYRQSYLYNGPDSMNSRILCESCHNGTHAEWVSAAAADNALPISIYGFADYIRECTACHDGSGQLHGRTGG